MRAQLLSSAVREMWAHSFWPWTVHPRVIRQRFLVIRQ